MSIPVPIPGLPIPGFPFPGPTGTPTIFAVIPGFGPTSGGNDVLILGTNLAGATSVTFGGTPANILAQDPIGILVLVAAPAHAAGSVPVVVTNATGSSAPATYTYLGGPIGPIVAALTPTSGTVAGGTTFTIVGANLAGATVTFNGAPATSVSVNATGTVLTGVTPAGAAGTATVVVATPAGNATVPGGFTYV